MPSSGTQLTDPKFVTAASVSLYFAPVPGLVLASAVLTAIYQLWEQAKSNKCAARDLAVRCYVLLSHLAATIKSKGQYRSDKIRDAILDVEKTLQAVQMKMKCWALLNRKQAFFKQSAVKLSIQSSHEQLNTCMMKLNFTPLLSDHNWQEMARIQGRRDHEELITYLSDIANSSRVSQAVSQENTAIIRQLMVMMKEV
ncbi:hypothetical protein DL96DRAFT_1639458 [Flagelloscypha sp. PMI_526]|nr:hypothetical protein DL96DRAFT_1639458 [Flagelloscypha sp. PMI_526]